MKKYTLLTLALLTSPALADWHGIKEKDLTPAQIRARQDEIANRPLERPQPPFKNPGNIPPQVPSRYHHQMMMNEQMAAPGDPAVVPGPDPKDPRPCKMFSDPAPAEPAKPCDRGHPVYH